MEDVGRVHREGRSCGEGPNGQSYLDRLPTEILVRVCGYLLFRDRRCVRLVCKRLCLVMDDPHLWRSLSWDGFSRSDQRTLRAALARHQEVITDRLSLCGSFDLAAFSEELCSCAHLQSLSLEMTPCSVATMATILRALPSLTRLQFQPVNTSCSMASCTHLMCRTHEWQDFLSAAGTLHSLTLLSHWDENFVEFLLRQWACLQYSPTKLCLSVIQLNTTTSDEDWQIRYSSFLDRWKDCLESFPPCENTSQFSLTWHRYRPQFQVIPLVELNLDGSPLSLSSALCYTKLETSSNIDTHGVLSLSGKKLFSENFGCGRYVSNNQFILSEMETKFLEFQSVVGHLTCINLSEAGNSFLSANLEIVAHYCRNLAQLNLSGCVQCLNPLFGLATLASNCTHLRALNLQNIPCNLVESTSEMWMFLSQMENLTHLAIDPCLFQGMQESEESTCEQRSVLSDAEEIEESVKTMSYIETLDLQTSLSVQKSIQCPICRTLDKRRMELVKYMSSLRYLHVRGISPTTCGMLLETTLRHCENLQCLYIHMDFAFCISSEALSCSRKLQQVAIWCPRLHITDDIIASLVPHNILTHVYFTVRSISKGSMTMLLSNFPHLIACHIYCRDGPVMQPPSEILEFRLTMRELVDSRTHPLDFAFNEGSSYDQIIQRRTAESMVYTELSSQWT